MRDIKDYFDAAAAIAETLSTTDADHGRIEIWHHAVIRDVDWLFAGRADHDHPATPG